MYERKRRTTRQEIGSFGFNGAAMNSKTIHYMDIAIFGNGLMVTCKRREAKLEFQVLLPEKP
jgi:hypothetical protein